MTTADVNIDVRGHGQIVKEEWGTYKYIYKEINTFPQWNSVWIYVFEHNPERFVFSSERPCGFLPGQWTTGKRILQGASYGKGRRALQTLSVTDKKAPAQYNFHTDYLHTRNGYSLCALRFYKGDGSIFETYNWIEPKKPDPPMVTDFMVNGDRYAVAVDYCREKINLTWATEKANKVYLFADREASTQKQQARLAAEKAKLAERENDTSGSHSSLRANKGTLYSIAAAYVDEGVNLFSDRKSVHVDVNRTQCFEECIVGAIDTAIPAAREARANENQKRCVGLVCFDGPSDDRLMCDAVDMALGLVPSNKFVGAPAFVQRAFVKVLCLGVFVGKEIKKNNVDCSGRLPDEDFSVEDFVKNIYNGGVKGFTHGLIQGFFSGLLSTFNIPFISCVPLINSALNTILSLITSPLVSQIGDALGTQFVGPPNGEVLGETIGYRIGDIMGLQLGSEAGSLLSDAVQTFVFDALKKTQLESCTAPQNELDPKCPGAPGCPPPPANDDKKPVDVPADSSNKLCSAGNCQARVGDINPRSLEVNEKTEIKQIRGFQKLQAENALKVEGTEKWNPSADVKKLLLSWTVKFRQV